MCRASGNWPSCAFDSRRRAGWVLLRSRVLELFTCNRGALGVSRFIVRVADHRLSGPGLRPILQCYARTCTTPLHERFAHALRSPMAQLSVCCFTYAPTRWRVAGLSGAPPPRRPSAHLPPATYLYPKIVLCLALRYFFICGGLMLRVVFESHFFLCHREGQTVLSVCLLCIIICLSCEQRCFVCP